MRYGRIATLLLFLLALGGIAHAEAAMPSLTLRVGESCFPIVLHDNPSARALLELLPLEIEMKELNGNEKYHYLSDVLPSDDVRPGEIRAGELMLYTSDCLVLFYEDLSSGYRYTKLGYIEDPSGLSQALGDGDVTVSFSIDSEAQ